MTNQEILNMAFKSTDLQKELTIRQFLKELLTTLFQEGECFSGKRPFGKSGWTYDMEKALINSGVIHGTFDEWGYIETSEGIHEIIYDLIEEL